MVRICNIEYLSQCVEIAFKRNSQPVSNCAFCSKSLENINRDFEFITVNPNCIMLGYFVDNTLIGILGCFMNPCNNWVDCIGPFFKDKWNHSYAKSLFLFAKTTLKNAVRFNFFFNTKNKDCHQLMGLLSAEQRDNEYILVLHKADYKPHQIKHHIVRYTDDYESELILLHDRTFPDVYVTGRDIVTSIHNTREVFCALDEAGAFTGYGVLKFTSDSKHLTAEIFAVKEEKRGKAYGWALLNTVIESAFNEHNGKTVNLVVDKLNTKARNLYYSCGFKLMVENESFCITI